MNLDRESLERNGDHDGGTEEEAEESGTESRTENEETSSSPTRSQETPLRNNKHQSKSHSNPTHSSPKNHSNQIQSPDPKINNSELTGLKSQSPIQHNPEESNGHKTGTNTPNAPHPDNNVTHSGKTKKEIKNQSSKRNNKPPNNTSANEHTGSGGSNSPSPSETRIRISPTTTPRGSGKRSRKGVNSGSRLSVTVPGSPFESGVNTECIQLLRQLWNVHEEAVQFLDQVQSVLHSFRQEVRSQENEFEISFREKRLSTVNFPNNTIGKKKFGGSGGGGSGGNGAEGSGSGRGKGGDEGASVKNEPWVPLQLLIDGLKCISDYFSDIDKQYLTLCVFQSQCKLALFAKVKHAKQEVSQDRLSVMHGIQHLISVSLHLISTPEFWSHSEEDRTTLLVQNLLQLTELYNANLESSCSMPMETALATSSTSLNHVGAESEGSVPQPSKPDAPPPLPPSSPSAKSGGLPNRLRVLVQIRAANRNNSPLLRLNLKPLSATRLLQILAQKRSTFAAHAFSRVTLSSFYADPKGPLTVDKFEACFTDEDSRLSPLGKGFSRCPSLLGRAAVKKTENGDQRLSRSARTKMYSYFHDLLWTLAGEHSEDLLIWGLHSNIIPLILHPLEQFIALKNSLLMAQHFQESNLSPMLLAFESVGGALHSFTLLANWDEKMRECFGETYKVKRPEQVSLLRKPDPAEWGTQIGLKFGEIVTSAISLIDSGNEALPNIMRSTLMRLSSNEEEPLGNEAQTLFRLEATLVYFKAWVVKRAKVWLNSWAIPQFLACSQREPALLVQLIKSRESVLITRDLLINNENVSIRLSAKHRQMCAEDLRTALHQLQSMPEELLQAVGPVCNTLSLATLQSYMPAPSHWKGSGGRGSGLNPDKPSPYVNVFIERVIEPVMTASVELVPGLVQEAMGKQVVHAASDAWLEFILQKKIRFSEWGAVQLLRDFTAFREWIHTETGLDKDARRGILQLEVLKRCEGVAYLLLRNPGDVLGVGKPTRKTRRVAPSSAPDSAESSPSIGDSSTAEDDSIPPEMYVPNQQMWLELRLRRGLFHSPCCQ